MAMLETLYAALLVIALVLNGIAITSDTSLRALIAPLREGGLVLRAIGLDVVLVPLIVVGLAVLLDVDPITRAALVIVSASSTGAIGMALTRIARGDVALSVTLVLLLGALNLVTVPLITGILLPTSIALPLVSLITGLLGLAVAPLIIGRLVSILMRRSRGTGSTSERFNRAIRRASDLLLGAAVTVALLLEPEAVLDALLGPVALIALAAMVGITIAARLVTSDPTRVRTLSLVINARAVALALAIATLYLSDVEGLRSTILAYGGLTQVVPITAILLLRRFGRTSEVSGPSPR